MKKYVKSILSILLVLSIIFNNFNDINAASFSLYANKTSVSPSTTVTFTISVKGCGMFSIKGENATVSQSTIWVDEKATFSAKVGKSGKSVITVKATDVATYGEEVVTGSKQITVTIVKPKTETKKETTTTKKPSSSGSTTTTTTKKPTTSNNTTKTNKNTNKTQTNKTTSKNQNDKTKTNLSNDNTLKSIDASAGTLTPVFSKKVVNYTLFLPYNTKIFRVDAITNDKKAFVSGSGNYEIKDGKQKVEIVCQSESGKKNTYTINVIVEQKPNIFLDYNDEKLEVVYDTKNVEIPSCFVETDVKINEDVVKGFKHKNADNTILCLKDSKGNIRLYNYSDGKVCSLFQYVKVLGREYIVVDLLEDFKVQSGMIENEIKIGDILIPGWTFSDIPLKDYSIAYLMNEQGEQNFYSYEASEGTIQKYSISLFKLTKEKEVFNNELLLVGGNLLFVAVTISFLYLYFYNKKINKNRMLMKISKKVSR